MCCVRTISGERYLLNKRLKAVEGGLDSPPRCMISSPLVAGNAAVVGDSAEYFILFLRKNGQPEADGGAEQDFEVGRIRERKPHLFVYEFA